MILNHWFNEIATEVHFAGAAKGTKRASGSPVTGWLSMRNTFCIWCSKKRTEKRNVRLEQTLNKQPLVSTGLSVCPSLQFSPVCSLFVCFPVYLPGYLNKSVFGFLRSIWHEHSNATSYRCILCHKISLGTLNEV